MNKLIALGLLFGFCANADTYVHGYTRRDGTYVQPHYRSNNDGVRDNNWSTQGNINPYTGQQGNKPLYPSNGYNNYNNNNDD